MKVTPKICLLTCLFSLDESHTLLYAESILAAGYPLIVICPGTIPESLSGYKFQHYQIPVPTQHFDFNSTFINIFGGLFQRFLNSTKALFYLFQTKPDICICIQPDSWIISIIGKLFLHNRVVVDLREIYEDRSSAFPAILQPGIRKYLRLVFKLLSQFTDEIIHVSEARQDHYSYLSKAGIIISPFPRLENFPNHKSINNKSEILVVHAGSLRWTYASDQFVEAIPIILEQTPNVKFVVIGGISSKIKNLQLIDSLVDSGKLVLIAQIAHEKVIDILLRSDIGINLVLPLDLTHILAMPRKFFEYMAAGLPVVGADVPTLRKIIKSTNCGILVDPTSPKSIADGIIRLASSQALRQELGDNARMSCEISYNWHHEEKKLLNLLSVLAAN